jgi:hypothetical protein
VRASLLASALVFVGCRGASGVEIGEAATAAAVSGAALVAQNAIRSAPSGSETSHIDAILDEAPRTGPRAVDLAHVRALLLETDIRECWPDRTPPAARDVQVTFRGNGTVVRVAVPHPQGLVTYDEACTARKLGDVIVDPFGGDDVVVGVTY